MEISSDSEEEQNVTPTKKRKLHYEQKYLQLWEKDKNYSSWIKKSDKGDYYCYCNVCKCDLKCGGGKRVLTKHAESIKHKNNIKGWCGVWSKSTYFTGVVFCFGFKLFTCFSNKV